MVNGRLTALRIQDVTRQIWFNWDSPARTWNASPSCLANGAVYVAAYLTNTTSAGNIRLRIVNAQTGAIIAQKSAYVARNASFGLEWSGTMPTANFQLRFEVADNLVV